MFTEYQWEKPEVADLDLVHEVLHLNNITVSAAIDYLGTTCDDSLLRCFWEEVEFPCFGNESSKTSMTWKPSYSFLGACCSFNYFPDTNGTMFYTESIGISGGLTFILTGAPQISDGKSGALYSEGFVVNNFGLSNIVSFDKLITQQLLIHHPYDFAVQSHYMTFLEQKHESFVEVYGSVLTSTDEVLGLPVEQRDCLTPEDVGMTFYRQPGCSLACVRDKIYDLCGCHPYNMPAPRFNVNKHKLRECIAKDAVCFVMNMSKDTSTIV